MATDEDRAVVHAEDIAARVDGILSGLNELIEVRNKKNLVDRTLSHDALELTADDLRRSVEKDSLPAVSMRNRDIDPDELNREIVTKALYSVDNLALRRLASARGVKATGAKGELAERVARAYLWDGDTIAKIVEQFETERSTSRGYTTRLFPIFASTASASLSKRLSYVENRYVRVGLARWFGFESSEEVDGVTRITGFYKAYQANVETRDDHAEILEMPTTVPVTAEIQQGSHIIQVHGVAMVPARAAVEAISSATGLNPVGTIPGSDPQWSAPIGQLHPTSILLIDLIYNRFQRHLLESPNVISARFKVRRGAQTSPQFTTKPRSNVKSVKFDGDYLLDSPASCSILAIDRRPLTDVTTIVLDVPSGLEFPVRITQESDHISVSTGFGADRVNAKVAHASAVGAVIAQLEDGPLRPDLVTDLIPQIINRASITDDTDEHLIFLQPEN